MIYIMQHAEVCDTQRLPLLFAELVLLTCLHLSLAGKPVWLKYSEQGEAVGVARGPTSAQGTGVLVMGGPLLHLCSAVLGERTCPLLSGSQSAL